MREKSVMATRVNYQFLNFWVSSFFTACRLLVLYLCFLFWKEMEDREVEAIQNWVGLDASSRKEARDQIQNEPFKFFEKNLDVLPPHLLILFAKVLTPSWRGKLARIRARRRDWIRNTRPEELSIEEARKRNPLLYKSFFSTVKRKKAQVMDTSKGTVVATNVAAASAVVPSSRLIDPKDVEKQQRFASVVDRLDEEDVMIQLRKQQGREAGETNVLEDRDIEEAEEEEDSEDEEIGLSREEEFQEEIFESYIRGDVSWYDR
jgi:hypothetical protein